jgi:hypothetical protein
VVLETPLFSRFLFISFKRFSLWTPNRTLFARLQEEFSGLPQA